MIEARLVSTAVLARALNVSPRTVNHWRNTKGLEPDDVTAGGHSRWDVERVKAWVKTQASKEEPPN